MKTADDFFAALKSDAKAEPGVTDLEGKTIPEFDQRDENNKPLLALRPLDVADMIKLGEHVKEHGRMRAFEILLVRGLRRADGSQLIPDERAGELTSCVNVPIKKLVDKIRFISGMMGDDEDETAEDEGQKKTTSTTSQT